MRQILLITIACALTPLVNAQAYTYFDSIYVVPDVGAAICYNLLQETEDGYLFGGGVATSEGQRPMFYDINLDGSLNSFDIPVAPSLTISAWFGKEFIPTSDGGSLWSGIGHFDGNAGDGVVIKYDEDLDTTWTFRETIADSAIWFYHPVEVADGYLVCGLQGTPQDKLGGIEPNLLILCKLNLDGELIWKKKHVVYDPDVDGTVVIFGDTLASLAYLRYSGIYVMDNGEIILSGSRYPHLQPFIAKLDSNGDNLQMYQFGNLEYPDWMPWLVPLDNHQFMVGYSETYELYLNQLMYPMTYPHLMLFDADSMQPIWDNSVTETTYYARFEMGMVQTPDGGFAKTGYYQVPGGQTAGYIEKWNADGSIDWFKTYTHEAVDPDPLFRNEVYEINVTQDGGFLLCGSYYDGNPQRGWVLKLDACGDIEDLGCPTAVAEFQISEFRFQIAPNPASGVVHISSTNAFEHILVRDITGKIVLTTSQLNALQTQVDVSMLAKGLYLIEVDFGKGQVGAQRLVVE